MSQTKVLLVDDELEFVSALTERLQLRNYDARSATNASEALTSIKKDPPDVVLLDLKIPGMDGIEILKKIKENDSTIQVIILTGYGDIESVKEAMRHGAFECVVKPVDIGELLIKIEQAKKKRYYP
jgi:DNA-binding NtrC family response regulator